MWDFNGEVCLGTDGGLSIGDLLRQGSIYLLTGCVEPCAVECFLEWE